MDFLKLFFQIRKFRTSKKAGRRLPFFIKQISNQNKKNDSKKTVSRIESERWVLFLFIYLNKKNKNIPKKCNQNMKTIKRNKKNNRNQFGSKFDERTNVSLVFFAVD